MILGHVFFTLNAYTSNLLNSFLIVSLLCTPIHCFTTSPLWKSIKVGIDMMPNFPGTWGFSSTFILAIMPLSPNSLSRSSRIGSCIRHGPHHTAQKSTNIGLSYLTTWVSKSWSVTVMCMIFLLSNMALVQYYTLFLNARS